MAITRAVGDERVQSDLPILAMGMFQALAVPRVTCHVPIAAQAGGAHTPRFTPCVLRRRAYRSTLRPLLHYAAAQAGSYFGASDSFSGLAIAFDSWDDDGQEDNPSVNVVLNDGYTK